MNVLRTKRVRWLLWLTALGFLVALTFMPVSYRITRAASLAFGFAVWFGLVGLTWRRRPIRFIFLGATLIFTVCLAWPSRAMDSADKLRGDYLAGLRRYEGVAYYWGGENGRGIDCSGLVRRGLIDALLRRGLSAREPGLVRQAIGLWWDDCTASALGEGHHGLTVRVLDTLGINRLDHADILPGDLAVTDSGVHIMAYLGEHRWIEADPNFGRVVILTAPTTESSWFRTPMRIVRWSILEKPSMKPGALY